MKFSRISIAVVATAVIVYFGLSLIFPHRKIEPKLDGGPSPDEVFSSSTSAASAMAESAPAAAQSDTAETNSTGDNGDKRLTEAEARKIAEEVGRKVATQVAQQLLQQQAANNPASAEAPAGTGISDADVHHIAQTEVANAVDNQAAKPAAVAEPSPSAATTQAGENAPAEKAKAEPKVAQAKPLHSASSSAKHDESSPSGNIAWWAPASGAANGFGLSFAGEAASTRAIALLFSMPIGSAAIAGSHIKVTSADGKTEPGSWTLAPNPRMMILHVAAPGRYTVTVGANVPSIEGKTLGITVKGPVYVH